MAHLVVRGVAEPHLAGATGGACDWRETGLGEQCTRPGEVAAVFTHFAQHGGSDDVADAGEAEEDRRVGVGVQENGQAFVVVVFRSDIPKTPRALPRYLTPTWTAA
jgi:hypothetical protein